MNGCVEPADPRTGEPPRTGFGALLGLELSRRFARRPLSKKDGQRSLGWVYTLLVLLLAVYGLAHTVGSAETLVSGAWSMWYVGLMSIGVSMGPGIVHRRSVDHWLALPFPRWQLVLAKWLAIVWSGLTWLLGVTALAAAVWVGALHVQPDLETRVAGATAIFLHRFVLALVVLPAGSAFALLPLAFEGGWGRWFRWVAPVLQWGVLGWGMLEGRELGAGGWATGTWLYQWITAGIVWALGLLSLLVVSARLPGLAHGRGYAESGGSSRRGLQRAKALANNRMENRRTNTLPQSRGEVPRALRWMERVIGRPAPAWLSLAVLFFQRDRWFGDTAHGRMSVAVIVLPVVVAVAVWFLPVRQVVQDPATAILLGSVLWTWGFLGHTRRILRESSGWLLAVPVRREILLWMFALADVVRMVGWWLLLEMGLLVGLVAHAVTHSLPERLFQWSLLASLRSGLLVILAVPLTWLVPLGSSFALRGAWRMLMLFEYGGILLLFPASTWVLKVGVLPDVDTGQWPHGYGWLVLAVVTVGIPLAIWSVRAGAKRLHTVIVEGSALAPRM
ncbi:hypothetical protein [Alicyclobacillus macrosporangiidus]|uniref:Uncharacterized protein n=1 Tax=Alicyclobacillus macrosporangiidus TaxID=392015 RepID=A0A1I7HFN1_9BACL|nr:hypothetical protein [Alicyclobacillus macrosporangiidus]SFU59369.1 hypothetical protein SAMN05421543_104164 [Alicyclobacillus macrosporangiidus]